MTIQALYCPTCQIPIAIEDVHMSGNRALCRQCGQFYAIDELLAAQEELNALNYKPKSIRVVKSTRGTSLHFRHKKTMGLFTSIFAIGFTVLPGTFLYIMLSGTTYEVNGVPTTGVDTAGLLFLIPFFAIGLGAMFVTLYLLFGTTRVDLESTQGKVTKSLFGFQRIKRFNINENMHASVGVWATNNSNTSPTYRLEVEHDGKTIKLGSGLKKEDLNYASAYINQYELG